MICCKITMTNYLKTETIVTLFFVKPKRYKMINSTEISIVASFVVRGTIVSLNLVELIGIVLVDQSFLTDIKYKIASFI